MVPSYINVYHIAVNVDYERLFLTQFEIKEGERFCRNITIINDQVIEGREFFLVVLEDIRWGEIIDTLAVVIEDEDCRLCCHIHKWNSI